DPQDPDTVYVTNLRMWKSTDGGRTFTEITTPHGDNHDLWIDPRDPRRMIEGNDGGACVTFNGGESWSTIYNQLTAQFYHVSIDDQHPYRVYGTQQDNSSVSVPSASENGGITWGDCYPAGTGESGYIAVHPRDPNIVYVGAVGGSPGGGGAPQRYEHRTRPIRPVPVSARGYGRLGGQGPPVPVRVDLPDRLLPSRPRHALRHGEPRLPHAGRGVELGGDQPRPHPAGRDEARGLGRSPHQGHQRGGALRHRVRVR